MIEFLQFMSFPTMCIILFVLVHVLVNTDVGHALNTTRGALTTIATILVSVYLFTVTFPFSVFVLAIAIYSAHVRQKRQRDKERRSYVNY